MVFIQLLHFDYHQPYFKLTGFSFHPIVLLFHPFQIHYSRALTRCTGVPSPNHNLTSPHFIFLRNPQPQQRLYVLVNFTPSFALQLREQPAWIKILLSYDTGYAGSHRRLRAGQMLNWNGTWMRLSRRAGLRGVSTHLRDLPGHAGHSGVFQFQRLSLPPHQSTLSLLIYARVNQILHHAAPAARV